MKVKVPVRAAGLSYRDRRGSSKKRAEDDEFNFFFSQSQDKKGAQDGKFKIGLQSQKTIHHENSLCG